MTLAQYRYRQSNGFEPLVACVRFDPHDRFGYTHWHVYVSTKPGVVYWREWSIVPVRRVVLNDFYFDQDMWNRSSTPVPASAEEVK